MNGYDVCGRVVGRLMRKRRPSWRGVGRGVGVLGVLACSLGSLSSCGSSAAAVGGRDNAKPVTVRTQVYLVPDLDAGSAGWAVCVAGERCGGGDARARGPILAQRWGGTNHPPVTEALAITTAAVRAVVVYRLQLISRHPPRGRYERVVGVGAIPTRTEAGLPRGLRVVEVQFQGRSQRLLREAESQEHRFFALNAKGTIINQPVSGVLKKTLPIQPVADAAHPSSGPCRIDFTAFDNVFPFEAHTVKGLEPQRNLFGHAFMSCASTDYKLGGWILQAGVLVDASDPGERPPMLPYARPLPGHPGVFEALGGNQYEVAIARRIPGAWLVVGEGHTIAQRLSILEHLRARVED